MNRSSKSTEKPVGLTASVGYQIGVRKTLPIDRRRAWERLLSAEGLSMWLGNLPSLELQVGRKYVTGLANGQIRVEMKERWERTIAWLSERIGA